MKTRFLFLGLCLLVPTAPELRAGENELRDAAAKGMRQATAYFRANVATHGGYLWRYSDDLARREGEGKATASQIWIQPPGTPSVGLAYLTAYQATANRYYLEAARETAMALVNGQLRSGGWHYMVDFNPKERAKWAYRVDPGSEKGRGMTTLDDNTTQEVMRFLMRVDKALAFKDAAVHDVVLYGLDCLIKAQYPNGAWPQRYERFPDPAKFPVKKASYPESWPRTFPKLDYRGFYTFNDNAINDAVEVMLEAWRTYGEDKYRAAADRAGDFIILAQMPEPQPAWAQQYDFDMHPAWARKFEPPAITGGESFGVMRCLLTLYRGTGDKKYLEPIPRALAYFRRSQLAAGQLARFYELKTNRPLYFTKEYQLTYRDDDLPTHYRFIMSNRMGLIAREYEALKANAPGAREKLDKTKPALTAKLTANTRRVLEALDSQGRWVGAGRLRYHGPDDPTTRVIDCATFVRNMGILSSYLDASR
jgi:PelA/Pel-15E family pectate lyase